MAAAFPIRTQASPNTIEVQSQVRFGIGPNLLMSFATNQSFPQITLTPSSMNIGGTESFGGYSTGAVTMVCTGWNITQPSGYILWQFNAVAAPGTATHFNMTNVQAVQAEVDGRDYTNLSYNFAQSSFMFNWTSWLTSHTFAFIVIPLAAPGTIAGQPVAGYVINYSYILGFFFAITLVLVGAYWIRERRGGA